MRASWSEKPDDRHKSFAKQPWVDRVLSRPLVQQVRMLTNTTALPDGVAKLHAIGPDASGLEDRKLLLEVVSIERALVRRVVAKVLADPLQDTGRKQH